MESKSKEISDDNKKELLAKFYEAIKRSTKEISKNCFTQFFNLDAIELLETKPLDLSHDHWIVLMVVGCPGINISFSCHFSSKTSRNLAEAKVGKRDSNPEVCHEFLSEYCNRTVGGLKSALSTLIPLHCNVSSEATITTPVKVPSFDETKADFNNKLQKTYWILKWKQDQIVCSVTVELSEKELFSRYKENVENLINGISTYKLDETGNIELF